MVTRHSSHTSGLRDAMHCVCRHLVAWRSCYPRGPRIVLRFHCTWTISPLLDLLILGWMIWLCGRFIFLSEGALNVDVKKVHATQYKCLANLVPSVWTLLGTYSPATFPADLLASHFKFFFGLFRLSVRRVSSRFFEVTDD